MSRTVIWYSDGAASTIAAKLTLQSNPDAILAYTATNAEHEDNVRFRKEVEEWLGKKVLVLHNGKYHDPWDVFDKTGWLVGPAGARCTTELKKKVRQQFQRPGDIHVFGYTADHKDAKRALRYKKNNFELLLEFPLIDRGITKADCKAMIAQQGIRLPMMYELGFENNNCIGCPKGQQKYWGRIRKHFPDIFDRMAKVERDMDVAINKSYAGDGKRKRLFLDQLPDDIDIKEPETGIDCGLFCGQYLED